MKNANNGGNPFNPGDWDWHSPSTYIGIVSGALSGYSQTLDHCEYVIDIYDGFKKTKMSELGDGIFHYNHYGTWRFNHTAFISFYDKVVDIPFGGVDNIRKMTGAAFTANRLIQTGFDIEKAIIALNGNAKSQSSGYCAKYVRYALEAGGINTNGHPVSAKDYNSFLQKKGFNVIAPKNYEPTKGDIAVMEAFKGIKAHPHGHIQMYNGSQWVSDFKQNNFWPGTDYRNYTPYFTILRW